MKTFRAIFIACLLFVIVGASFSSPIESASADNPGPVLVEDINPGAADSTPVKLVEFNDQLFFQADDGVHGLEWWVSDGVPGDASLFTDLNPGSESISSPYTADAHLAIGNQLFFKATVPDYGSEVWVTNGTVAGTHMVVDSVAGTESHEIGKFLNFNNELVYESVKMNAGVGHDTRTLWKSNGTEIGTVLLDNSMIDGEISDSYIGLIVNEPSLLFTTRDNNFINLYKSDGTYPGTQLINHYTGLAAVTGYMANLGDYTFFYTAKPGEPSQWLLRRTDGTATGTIQIYTSYELNLMGPMIQSGGWVYFTARDLENKYRLYRTQGTMLDNVELVYTFTPPISDQGIFQFINYKGILFFSANNGAGRRLWTSDGTESGTVELNAAPNYEKPSGMILYMDELYFAAEDADHGRELWVTDGTTEGTHLVSDINPGSDSSNPENFTVAGNKLYFSANDGVHGIELIVYDLSPKKIYLYLPSILN